MKKKEQPAVMVDHEQAQRFLRFDITLNELLGVSDEAQMVARLRSGLATEPLLTPTVDDLYHAWQMKQLRQMDDQEFGDAWLLPLTAPGCRMVSYEEEDHEFADSPDGLPDEASEANLVWEMLKDWYYELSEEPVRLDQAVGEMKTYLENRGKPLDKRVLTQNEQYLFTDHWMNDRDIADAPKALQQLFVTLVNRQCRQKDPQALLYKALACFGLGRKPFQTDWAASERCLKELLKIASDPLCAALLGEIYFYGLTSSGLPRYQDAFSYLSLAALGQADLSELLVGDMLKEGNGVVANEEMARELYRNTYKRMLSEFSFGDSSGRFAEAAFRMGETFREGLGDFDPDALLAYMFYMQARFALKQRRKVEERYGDAALSQLIDRRIAEVLPKTDMEDVPSYNSAILGDLSPIYNALLAIDRPVDVRCRKDAKGHIRLTFAPAATHDGVRPRMLLTIPDCGFCGLMDRVTVTMLYVDRLDGLKPGMTLPFDWAQDDQFYLFGTPIATVKGEFRFHLPPAQFKPYRLASVQTAPAEPMDICLAPFDVRPGDWVIVPYPAGEEKARVLSVFEQNETEMSFPLHHYLTVRPLES